MWQRRAFSRPRSKCNPSVNIRSAQGIECVSLRERVSSLFCKLGAWWGLLAVGALVVPQGFDGVELGGPAGGPDAENQSNAAADAEREEHGIHGHEGMESG